MTADERIQKKLHDGRAIQRAAQRWGSARTADGGSRPMAMPDTKPTSARIDAVRARSLTHDVVQRRGGKPGADRSWRLDHPSGDGHLEIDVDNVGRWSSRLNPGGGRPTLPYANGQDHADLEAHITHWGRGNYEGPYGKKGRIR